MKTTFLAEDDEEQVHVPENEVEIPQSPNSESEIEAKKGRANVVDVSDGEGEEFSPPMEPANADSAEEN